MIVTRTQRYYSHKVLKNRFGMARNIGRAKAIRVPHDFEMEKESAVIRNHIKRLIDLGYNIQYIIQ